MFSIIIPNFNRQNTIIKSINSVLNQTYSNFELIIVDDCSTDDSLREISKIKDKRIKVYQMEKNSGAAAARNFGIKKSSGNFISFLDSDDFYEDNFLKISFGVMNKSPQNIGFMWTGRRLHLKNHVEEEIWIPKKLNTTYLTFLHNLSIGTGAGITLKKEVFENCGDFNENLTAAEDTEFFLRIARKYDYSFSKNVLINIYRENSDRISKNYKNIALAYNIFIENHIEEIKKDNQLKIKYFYKLMWLNYHLSNKKKAREYYNMVPLNNIAVAIKVLGVRVIYEIFPLKIAQKIHFKLA